MTRDYTEMLELYKKSAEQGYSKAQSDLAVAYSQEMGVKRDISVAYNWTYLAAEQGLSAAKNNLEYMRKRMTSDEIKSAKSLIQEHEEKANKYK